MFDIFNYLFGVNNRCRVVCGVSLPGFLVEGFSMSGRLVFLTLWSLIDEGVGIVWGLENFPNINRCEVVEGAGIVGGGGGEGLENFRNINSRGRGIFQNFQNFPSCIFQPVHPKQVSPRLTDFSYHLARIF